MISTVECGFQAQARKMSGVLLLEDGSDQSNLWGANWYPNKQMIDYESLINIRSRDNNRSMEVQDPKMREKIREICLFNH